MLISAKSWVGISLYSLCTLCIIRFRKAKACFTKFTFKKSVGYIKLPYRVISIGPILCINVCTSLNCIYRDVYVHMVTDMEQPVVLAGMALRVSGVTLVTYESIKHGLFYRPTETDWSPVLILQASVSLATWLWKRLADLDRPVACIMYAQPQVGITNMINIQTCTMVPWGGWCVSPEETPDSWRNKLCWNVKR